MLSCAKLSSFAVRAQSLGKLVEADVGDSEVAKDNSGIEDLSLFFEYGISTLIECDGILKPVLTVKDVANVSIEAGQAEQVAMFFKDRSRSLAPIECKIVFSEIDQTLQRSAHGAREFQFPVERGIDRNRCLIVLACELVFVPEVVDVSECAQPQGA